MSKSARQPPYLLRCLALTLALCSGGAVPAASQVVVPANDPVLERRVQILAEELRCLVCQNQTIADSHADLAIDLKNQVREKLAQGSSDKEVIDFMVQRYGDFVLYRPPVKSTTWLLWFGPFLLLAFGLIFLASRLRRQRAPADTTPPLELARAAALLAEQPSSKDKT